LRKGGSRIRIHQQFIENVAPPVIPRSCKRRGISLVPDSAKSRSFACAQDDILGAFFNKLLNRAGRGIPRRCLQFSPFQLSIPRLQ
jgi:hypothetical protein